jgi:hypothetical protein
MRGPRRLTNLSAYTTCYRESSFLPWRCTYRLSTNCKALQFRSRSVHGHRRTDLKFHKISDIQTDPMAWFCSRQLFYTSPQFSHRQDNTMLGCCDVPTGDRKEPSVWEGTSRLAMTTRRHMPDRHSTTPESSATFAVDMHAYRPDSKAVLLT